MENKHIILVLIIIITLLVLAIASITVLNKPDSKLAFLDTTVYSGDSLTIKLTDEDENPIAGETVNVKITSANGKVTEKNPKTNSKGKVSVKLDDSGMYSVECRFDGNANFDGTRAFENVTVEKAATSVIGDDKTSNFNSVSGLSSDGYSYYPEYGPEVDAKGTTRQEAQAKGMHYIPQTIDGMDAGVYVKYDSVNGAYHT